MLRKFQVYEDSLKNIYSNKFQIFPHIRIKMLTLLEFLAYILTQQAILAGQK